MSNKNENLSAAKNAKKDEKKNCERRGSVYCVSVIE